MKYYDKYPIVKETDKTIIVKKVHGDYRYYKNELLVANPTLKNDNLSGIRFTTICYEADVTNAIDLLEKAMAETVEKLIGINNRALTAFNSGSKSK